MSYAVGQYYTQSVLGRDTWEEPEWNPDMGLVWSGGLPVPFYGEARAPVHLPSSKPPDVVKPRTGFVVMEAEEAESILRSLRAAGVSVEALSRALGWPVSSVKYLLKIRRKGIKPEALEALRSAVAEAAGRRAA